jgi:hypothetical protein
MLRGFLAVAVFYSAVAVAGEAPPAPVTLTVDFAKELGPVAPRTGFLGGLRDEQPDELIRPLQPALWRIGHQFRGRIKAGLAGAVTRVGNLGARYKLVMSDLVPSWPGKGQEWKTFDWAKYEAGVKKLVAETGDLAPKIIWEPVNEPDCNQKPIENYYEMYARAFKALREANKDLDICGPGFAFPSYEKYAAFLNYCREKKLECNYLAWHYTGWDPHWPEQAKWKLGKMREFVKEYPEQKIKEIHCDEWGAGPDKPGRLHPGRAIVWFHYLENVYPVDRACRANWGNADDYLGGIVTPKGEPYPVYHAYRLYAQAKGQTRVEVVGNGKTLAALASKDKDRCEIILGSIQKGVVPVTLELKGLGAAKLKAEARLIPATNLDAPLADKDLPIADCGLTIADSQVRITLQKVEENQAYHIVLTKGN